MCVSKDSIKLAVHNIVAWGDTDVLPFPLENHWFHDAPDKIVGLLKKLDDKFDSWLETYPVAFDRCLSSVGHTGYRGVTQIDPIWNAYLLALVIEIGSEIEAARIPVEENKIFSYRFSPNQTTYSLFDTQIGWRQFQEHAYKLSQKYKHTLFTDISDFYPRIYHHRLENELDYASQKTDVCKRIKVLLKRLSIGGVSYGLPIGGSAARLLSEIILNRTDRLLNTKGVQFCRFVDDYYIFSNSEEEARRFLVYLSDILLRHEGLSLNRGKIRLMTREQFAKESVMAEDSVMESQIHSQTQKFFKLRLKYDPYSPTAEEDYKKLRKELARFDVVDMLAREFRKSRIDKALTKQLIKSLRYLDTRAQSAAIESLISNLNILYPIFPTVSVVIRELIPNLSSDLSACVFNRVRALLHEESHILQVSANLAFSLRLLVDDPSVQTDQILDRVYRNADSVLVRRDVILCMARREARYWLADVLRGVGETDLWLRRALIVASFVLGDEGDHWRNRVRKRLHDVDLEFMGWIKGKDIEEYWRIPI